MIDRPELRYARGFTICTQPAKKDAYQVAAEKFGYKFEVLGMPGELAPYFFDSKRRKIQPNEVIIKVSNLNESHQSYFREVDRIINETQDSSSS